jgi:hypothetical protein
MQMPGYGLLGSWMLDFCGFEEPVDNSWAAQTTPSAVMARFSRYNLGFMDHETGMDWFDLPIGVNAPERES